MITNELMVNFSINLIQLSDTKARQLQHETINTAKQGAGSVKLLMMKQL